MPTTFPRWALTPAILVALLCGAGPARAQDLAVSGTVRDQATGRPIAAAQVALVGTQLVAETGPDGRYRLRNVPPGQRQLRVSAFGYAPQTRTINVAATGAGADFALAISALELDEVVATATGQQTRREVPHTVTRVDVATITATKPISNMNDLLVARVPGVTVTPGNITGAEARVRIRGANSLSLSNDPVYIIDGIRMQASSGSSSIGVGGTLPSRVNDINPEEIETMEFVKGPSASALYGTDAANGVIVITTKRGRAGRVNWDAYTEVGSIRDYNPYPTAYRGYTSNLLNSSGVAQLSAANNGIQCILTQVAAKLCTQDRLSTFNLFEDPDATPNGTGNRQQHGLQLNGGSDQVRFFASGEWEDETGVLQMPRFARDTVMLRRQVSSVPEEQVRPNAKNRVSVRANLSSAIRKNLDIDVSTGYISSNQRSPQIDNNTTGLQSNAYGGPGNKDNVDPSTGRALVGYRAFTPDQFFSETVTQQVNRFIGAGTANWRPFAWLTARMTGGVDYSNRVDSDLCRRTECTTFSSRNITGFVTDNRTNFHDYTLDASGTAERQVRSDLKSRTSLGFQYTKRLFERNGADAEDLAPGATTLSAGAIPTVSSAYTKSVTLGTYIDQQLQWREKVYVDGALRVDNNSAFGSNFNAVLYPKLGASWVVSEESFFPAAGTFDNLRLRAAWGVSGVQPGSNDALAYYSPTKASVENVDRAAIVFTALGNKDLKPERSTEIEGGFDMGVWHNRVGLEFTAYHKTTKNSLIARTVAPSVGASTTRFENLGSVENKGVELGLNASLINRAAVSWDATAAFSHNKNKIRDLGGVPPIIGTTISQKVGAPLNAYWQRPYTYSDADNNGIITANEIVVGDTAVFVGPNLPENELTFTTTFGLFHGKLQLRAGLDRKSGHYQLNGTERIRCESRLNCRGLVDPSAPLWMQARVVALRETAARTQYGFIEKSSFTRLREISATWNLPDQIASRWGARRTSLTFGVRNAHVWSPYSGIDPEAGYFEGTDVQSDFQANAPPTYFTLRANLNF